MRKLKKGLVSIIIPSWNRKEDVRALLTSLKKLEYKDYEVIIVDNGSKDGSVELIRKDFPSVRLYCYKKNYGAPKARNKALFHVQGEYTWVLDSDTEVLNPRIVDDMLEIFEKHEDVGVIGGEIHPQRRKQVIGLELKDNGASFPVYFDVDDTELHDVECVATANAIFRTESILKTRGFDDYYMYMGEDKDIEWKVLKQGYRVVCTGRTGMLHKVSQVSRISSLPVLIKAKNKFVLGNYPLWKIVLLPVFDLVHYLNPSTYRMMNVKRKERNQNLRTVSLLRILFFFVWGMVYGYVWNLIYLPQTLWVRWKRPNFIQKAGKE